MIWLYLATRSVSRSADGTLLRFSWTASGVLFVVEWTISFYESGIWLGVQLRVISETNQEVQLAWDGNFSWSNDLIKLWAGDRYLTSACRW